MSVAEGRVDELLVNNNFSQMGSITDQGSYVGSDDDFIKAPITKVISSKGKVYIVEEVDMPEHINISQRLRY
ncbi:hypothetical protein ACF3NG_05345 [Aerococcaceae bacterium WGS1372]